MKPLGILYATSEVSPLIKTGGLADVAAALPRALRALGHDARVVLPAYAEFAGSGFGRHVLSVRFSGFNAELRVGLLGGDLPVYLVDCPPLFARPGNAYLGPDMRDWPDNAERFALFGAAVAALARSGRRVGFPVDVLALNDWQTGLAAPLLARYQPRPAITLTVHNLAYRGEFEWAAFERLGLPRAWWSPDAMEFYGKWSFLKAGIVFADAVTTVSETYAREITTPEHGEGFDGLLRWKGNLHGIVNGIDTCAWNPATDTNICAPYDVTHPGGKIHNSTALRRELGLAPGAAPLIGVVSRLAHQKGSDVLADAVPGILGLPAQLVVLGDGDPQLATRLAAAAAAHPGRLAVVHRFDESLAHRVIAGADLFLMPSRFEPCGLSQLYAMRYGAVPVVRRTGGLADTVRQVWSRDIGPGTGFLFDDPTPEALVATLRSALDYRDESSAWRRIQHNGMSEDWSWTRSAARYAELYHTLAVSRG